MKVLLAAIALAALSLPTRILGGELPPVRIGQIQIREFDSGAGEWRLVKLRDPDFFYGWNWRALESGGSNDDFEILIPVTGIPSSEVPQPLVVTVTSRRSQKVLESRQFTGVKLPADGTTHEWVESGH